MNDWQERPLKEFLARITYGFTNPMPTTDVGPYMITARDINHGRILYDQARSTSEKAFREELTDKSRPDLGDVLVTKDGTLGRIAIVDKDSVCINQSVALLKPSSSIRSRFLKYLLEEPNNHARMLGDADGTTIEHIYITRLAKMKVCVPSLATQDAVVSVLSAFDDKIDLNRRMNETLEAMARAIFKDWFIDFGPTRAKMEGRAPYLAPDIWALFPDRLDTEGKPEGWENRSIYEITEVIYGAPFASSLFNSEKQGEPLIRIRDLVNESPGVWTSEVHPKGRKVRPGDIVVGMDGEFRAYLWGGAKAWLNQRVCVFAPKRGFSAPFVRNSIIGPSFTVTAPVDTGPAVNSVTSIQTTAGKTFAASSLFTASDPFGDAIEQCDFWDSGAGGGSFRH
jgi:type I restriction enzyme S subunit